MPKSLNFHGFHLFEISHPSLPHGTLAPNVSFRPVFRDEEKCVQIYATMRIIFRNNNMKQYNYEREDKPEKHRTT